MSPTWSYVLTFVVGLILGVILGVLFFADDASAAAEAVVASRGWCHPIGRC